eukprot:Protomagalhaensia_sp_Gyna_25__4935@NODE_530_length_3197_cov_160_852438_g414_i0_p1_GENE_NODE_530_length_3197_cov_160_852438_g414_i0NODE_530_length_3197_cov_160_852438_g414_i0_p1_ORF_typecomplete_len585_score114_15TPR_15/PF13429_6/52TPR_15/PF13429_6/0_018TPR_2/PF07719_17/0_42TPR_2/PF07719_17/11YfiO/PF13525_6/46YfiO/PF13525_6/0_17TPR_16/PF13432_6/79TPR_16/PF13432_6/0_4TPR_8/PF13181_6/7_2e02TPR_8/PF13181_6/0_059ANAPC3/PF12895_7/2e02ANAPC3/PF12895_7/0_19TPR_19/PF14559_6/0_041ChAPs/PF09295_10/2_1e03Ch
MSAVDGDYSIPGSRRVEAGLVEVAEGEAFPYEGEWKEPDPFELKENGNAEYKKGNYRVAIDIWKLALKQSLKLSCRHPSKALFDIQMTLRMNLALGFIRDDDLVMAKEHMMVVFQNKHDEPKVFYRFAEIYLGLQDYEKALSMVDGGLKEFPEDVALKSLRARIHQCEREYDRQRDVVLKERVSLDLKDGRSDRVVGDGLMRFDRSEYSSLLKGEAGEGWRALSSRLIEWRFNTDELHKGEVHTDIDDSNSALWRHCWTSERLKDDKSIIYGTIPLSILSVLQHILIQPSMDSMDTSITFRGSIKKPGPLPQRSVNPQKLLPFKQSIVDWLTRQSTDSINRPFTIHCIGSRGDMEMETKWGMILERCPALETLQVVMVGFLDSDDVYSRRLSDGYLSPPLIKTNRWRINQRVIARLYKGNYTEFINSELVQPSILNNNIHPLHPDLILIPEPSFHKHFQDWIPTIAILLLANIPILFLGQSVITEEFVSQDAISITKVLDLIKADYVLSPKWNRFGIPLDPGEDAPPMNLIIDDNKEISYQGPSGKYAFVTMCKGLKEDAPSEVLVKLANGEGIEELVALANIH